MRLAVAAADTGAVPGLGRSVVRALWLGLCIPPAFAGFLPSSSTAGAAACTTSSPGRVVVHTARRT